MKRRDFLRATGVATAGFALPAEARDPSSAHTDGWRRFEVTTNVEVLKPAGTTRVWLPMPLATDTPYQKALGNSFRADGGTTSVKNDAAFATGILAAEWPEGVESRNLGGKCADLNALYVGLARAAELPARDVYGIRVAKSQRGFKSLGAASENVTKSQHCRAEVFVGGYGWVPVDPADVRKVALEEPPGNRPLDDELVAKAQARLFGSWEMNWMAYNYSHDVALPGSKGPRIGFFMYPQCETAQGRLDSLDADNFRYVITSREIA
jgi:hypothetical protein